MTSPTPTQNPDTAQTPFDLTTDFADRMLELQSAQFQAITSWQQLMSHVSQELWDEWTARWGGGVPIDA
jgi:hypothetical protein